MTRWRRLAGRPGVQVILLGGLLFAARHGFVPPSEEAGAAARSDEEVLLEQALALGLDRRDPFVRARLAGLAELARTGGVEDAAELERAARRLGLERHDLVVRRHLVQAMELALARGGARRWPSEAELAAHLAAHPARYAQPARWRFRHVFFARDRWGGDAAAAAQAAAAELARAGTSPPVAAGDAFLAGTTFAATAPDVARTFGPAFAAALDGLPAGRWAGPVESAYGWHVVWLDAHTPSTVPPLDAVRSRAVHAVLAEQAAARLADRLARVREERS
jgi:hypothetical protein